MDDQSDKAALKMLSAYTSFLSSGNATHLELLPSDVQSAAMQWKTMEASCPLRGVVAATSHAGSAMEEEFAFLSQSSGRESYGKFAEVLYHGFVERALQFSDRTFTSGILLFIKYLAASIAKRAEAPNCSVVAFQRRADYSLYLVAEVCMQLVATFFDGRRFANVDAIVSEHRDHVLDAVDFDVADGSPMDYIGLMEHFVSPAFAYVCSDWLRSILVHPVCLTCTSASRLAAASIAVAVLRTSPVDPAWFDGWTDADSRSYLEDVLHVLRPAEPVEYTGETVPTQ